MTWKAFGLREKKPSKAEGKRRCSKNQGGQEAGEGREEGKGHAQAGHRTTYPFTNTVVNYNFTIRDLLHSWRIWRSGTEQWSKEAQDGEWSRCPSRGGYIRRYQRKATNILKNPRLKGERPVPIRLSTLVSHTAIVHCWWETQGRPTTGQR